MIKKIEKLLLNTINKCENKEDEMLLASILGLLSGVIIFVLILIIASAVGLFI